MKQEILRLIEKSNKEYDKKSQRAELLKRNEIFLKELKGIKNRFGKVFFKVKSLSEKRLTKISDENILLKLDYPKIKILALSNPYKSKKDYEKYVKIKIQGDFGERGEVHGLKIENDSFFNVKNLDLIYEKKTNKIDKIIKYKNEVLERYKEKWDEFCNRWHINPKWNGRLSNLSNSQRPFVEIYTDYDNEQMPIIIQIGFWTTLEDIRNRWKVIEDIQKSLLSKEEKSSTFARDICWFDLNKKLKLRPRQIGELWIKYSPEDIDLLVIRRIKNKIEKKDFNGKVLSDDDLLRAIKSGFLKSKYKSDFDEEKEWYVSGQTERAKLNPPFIDVIKKAVKRFEKRIHILDLPSPIDVMHPPEP